MDSHDCKYRPALLLRAGCGLVALTLLSACGARDDGTTGSLPDDYRTRHPIVVTNVQHAIELPVAPGSGHLTQGMSDMVTGFSQNYRNASSGYVDIMVPSGSPNATAAVMVAKRVKSLLVSKGIPAVRIVTQTYPAAPSGDAAPIRLSYMATTATVAPCGQWPEDLSDNISQNRNWENFGCASQANLAAQIASPTDLIAPRGMSPIDAERRATVITNFESGTDTSTTSSSSSSSSSSN
ncbi:CpaD family pilus assembly lipoprotein [Allorhizobium sp. BGMRC 0089]|uniref:CpaD family pilus assembly protein n=1 Tax=Allorhizobium sonneratiae TaxID=2934936 RepID=UPI0020349022|nr:CpaD family pilus assembly lipoprotein [Allorhizobium sonneratiae]MCM2291765.1 CpaD family pilus assembly lipoprotein [Allorhizobium sonneratiae]